MYEKYGKAGVGSGRVRWSISYSPLPTFSVVAEDSPYLAFPRTRKRNGGDRRHGIPPAPKRSASGTSKDFIAAHMAALAGVDFFIVEVLTWQGLITCYVLFFRSAWIWRPAARMPSRYHAASN